MTHLKEFEVLAEAEVEALQVEHDVLGIDDITIVKVLQFAELLHIFRIIENKSHVWNMEKTLEWRLLYGNYSIPI